MQRLILSFLAIAVTSMPVKAETGEASAHIRKATRQVNEVAARLDQPQTESFRIIRYIENGTNQPLVMLSGGRNMGIVEGAVFKSYRRANSPVGKSTDHIWVQTGTLKAVQLNDDFAIAEIMDQETMESRVLFPKHPGIMANDWVIEHKVTLSRSQIVTPTATIEYHELFEDPKAFPMSFELSEKGKEHLNKVAEAFAHAKLPLLLVEAYTDKSGPSDANQVESYQRAMAIRQYLVEELAFDPARVVAIGFGEGEQVGKPYIPGSERRNRRIVLKVKSYGSVSDVD